jgi:hypothetical protein
MRCLGAETPSRRSTLLAVTPLFQDTGSACGKAKVDVITARHLYVQRVP